ncbi:winged helix-turn-helix domain-containing protein [Streptomyces endophyticus]|uniref:Winged helix-turn-helix domain-containing protein n=1 Tax=Streptomyces endophyticus TaxID=714166 RepID=A0ABU6FJ84_9ACTN|nr:winged helix-turn-helix domain-containing protein [Streptomyces endophyticus]MEB8344108.1 winged helix-turn-helix domain-containing protein [Streptomyces endophyticus]
MSEKIDPTAAEYHYVQLAEILERRIRGGEFAPGTRIPGEMVLAQEYGIGNQTVRRALVILRDKGLVVTVHARGTFVVRELPPT